MRVNDLLQTNEPRKELVILGEQCSQFLDESGGNALLQSLPQDYNDFHKVKVRKRRKHKHDTEHFAEVFNEAFEHELRSLRERAVFANGEISFEPADIDSCEPFYIFPIDGYRFLYSKEVENSSEDYKTVFESIFEKLGSDKGNEIITELLKFTYNSTNLKEGIEQGSEIIIYNIPYFYAVRASTANDYSELLTAITESV